jgi:hypothetical protein
VAGHLSVVTDPPGGLVFLDGQSGGAAPVDIAAGPGEHKIVVIADGHLVLRQTVRAESGGSRVILHLEPARLPAAIAGPSGLKIRCRSAGQLRILVDGADTGRQCPNEERISVQPGHHKVGLLSPMSGELHEVDVEVGADAHHSARVYVKY